MFNKDAGLCRQRPLGGGGSSYPTPIGASLMKTGQTTSYRTGDDGDIEAGRGTDWVTLPLDKDGNQLLNPFGNNKRFTGLTGGYQVGGVNYDKDGGTTTAALAFPNDIVIDWSTTKRDGTKVLGYKRTLESSGTAPASTANALTASIGTYTSGWRMLNFNEMVNLIHAPTQGLNYNPFNISAANTIFRCSTNCWGATGYSWYWNANAGVITFLIDGENNKTMIVREFSVSGTTLT